MCPSIVFAATRQDALNDAAAYFVREAVRIPHGQSLFIGKIVNHDSEENDTLGQDLENDIYFALERLTPDFKLVLDEQPESETDLSLVGSYELEGATTILRLKVVQGIKKQTVLALYHGEYTAVKTRDRMLVAVLDLEAPFMDEMALKAFSEIMRGAFSKKGAFDIVNSADVDKLDSEAIQKASGCTRDECATIIGEQLGVDRVVSSSLFRVDENLYVLSGKIINIRDGAIIKSRTVKHNGALDSLDTAVEYLVQALVAEEDEEGAFVQAPSKSGNNKDRFQRIVEPFIVDFTNEISNAFSEDDAVVENKYKQTFNIDVMRLNGLGLSWTTPLFGQSFWTTGISYAPGIFQSGDDLLLFSGYKYLIAKRLAIFNFHVGGNLVLSRNDGFRYPYIMMGTDFLFMYMGFDIPTSRNNPFAFYFGFKFEN